VDSPPVRLTLPVRSTLPCTCNGSECPGRSSDGSRRSLGLGSQYHLQAVLVYVVVVSVIAVVKTSRKHPIALINLMMGARH
jgi:hypothetical protein